MLFQSKIDTQTLSCVGMQCVIVVIPDHTHLLFHRHLPSQILNWFQVLNFTQSKYWVDNIAMKSLAIASPTTIDFYITKLTEIDEVCIDVGKKMRKYLLLGIICVIYALCLSCLCICLLLPCGHLWGKGWPLGSCLWCLFWFCYFPIWCLGTGVILDYIHSWSLLSLLHCLLKISIL